MTLVRKLAFITSSLVLAALGVLAAGSLNTADALTLPTGTTLTVTVPTVLPPTVTVPPVTTALPPPPPVVTTVLPPVTTVLPPVPPPPTATVVVPPPPPPVATVTTRVPTTPTVPAVTAVAPPPPAPAQSPVATAPARASGASPAPAGAASPQSASSAEATPDDAGASVVVDSSGGSSVPTTWDDLSAGAAQAEAARRSSVGRVLAERPGLVRGKKGARGVITFTFRVPRRGTVVVTVTRVAPSCRVVGTFEVRGRPGVNRVRWSGRVDGRLLPPGTYRLAPRLVRSGPPVAEQLPAAVRGMPVVILPSQASPRLLEDRSALARLRSRNVCRWETGGDQEGQLIGSPFVVDLGSVARPAVAGDGGDSPRKPGIPAGDDTSAASSGVLGAVATPFGDGSGGSRFAGAVLLLLLVPALVLLTLAAVPHRALLRVPATALARHHDEFVLLGLGWVVVWGLYIGVVYALSVVLE